MGQENENSTAVYNVDFEKIQSMAFSFPISYRFFRKQERKVSSWKELYALVLRDLAHLHPDQFAPSADLCALPEGEIGGLQQSKKMKRPVAILRGIYAETELGTETMIRRIRNALAACEIPYDHLTVVYSIDEKRKEQHQQMLEQTAKKPKIYTLDWDVKASYTGVVPVSYKYKGRNTQKISSWSDIYVQLLTDLQKEYPKKIKHGVSVGGRRTFDICSTDKKTNMRRPQDMGNGLLLETYGSATILIDRMYQFLCLCKVDTSQVIIKYCFKTVEREQEFLQQMPGRPISNQDTATVDKKVFKRLRKLLEKNFDNGFRVNSSIDMGRMRDLYMQTYKEQLPDDDHEVLTLLLSLNQPIDGRIYAKRTAEQNEVIKQILQEVDETFKAGASCIYLQSILERYKDQLAEHLRIYTADALAQVIIASSARSYSVMRNCLCFGRRKPDADGEIMKELQKRKVPVSISDLTAQFWYIPATKINQTMITTDAIVNIGREHYYYAPNLPIDGTSRSRIRGNLKSALAMQEALSEMELLDIVLQECPNLLGDIPFLSWKGLRNSLLFLFRDVISLDGHWIKLQKKTKK